MPKGNLIAGDNFFPSGEEPNRLIYHPIDLSMLMSIAPFAFRTSGFNSEIENTGQLT